MIQQHREKKEETEQNKNRKMSRLTFAILFVLVAVACSFTFSPRAATRPTKLTMLFNLGGKKPVAAAPEFKVGEGTANKGTYVPEGVSKEAYAKFLKAEADKAAAKKKKFPKGKQAETLTEWMLKEQAKGNTGKDLLMKGHRMVKCKYDEWFTDESPV